MGWHSTKSSFKPKEKAFRIIVFKKHVLKFSNMYLPTLQLFNLINEFSEQLNLHN